MGMSKKRTGKEVNEVGRRGRRKKEEGDCK